MKKVLMVIGLLVCALMLSVFERNAIAEEKLDLKKLTLLAEKLETPIDFGEESVANQTTDEFAALTPEEVFELRKIHRKIYWPKYAGKMNRKQVLVAAEKIDMIIFNAIKEEFGLEATFYNLSDDQISWLMDELMRLKEIRQLTTEMERGLNVDKTCKGCTKKNDQGEIGILGTSCDYVPDWPRSVPFREGIYWGYVGYKCDRVKNDPNEWPCDFRIYINSRNYKEVDGGTMAMRCALRRFGSLAASSSLDRFIVGYWRLWSCGALPYEWYVRSTVTFRD